MDEQRKQQLDAALETFSEVEYYFMIEECGGFMWIITHGMSHGHVPDTPEIQEDIKNVREVQEYVVSQLGKFGVDPLSISDRENGTYWKWYSFWHTWHPATGSPCWPSRTQPMTSPTGS